MPDSEPKGEMHFAYYPLSDFDSMLRGTGITLGWLVEGIVDKARLEVVLQNLVSKWPLLDGRLESVMGEQGMQLRVKVPLPGSESEGEDGYAPFVLTSRDSEEPITRFIDVPLPTISDSLPLSLFKDTSAPSDPRAWESEQQQGAIPLMHWHLTFFRPKTESKHDRPFTCIGLTFSHVVFDGMGIASVVHALAAESLDRPWGVSPAPLVPGDNENALAATLDRIENAKRTGHGSDGSPASAREVEYHSVSILGPWFILCRIMWHIWQSIWHGTQSRTILLVPAVYEKLVEDTREEAALHGMGDVRLSTGDVLAAFLLKAIYSTETNRTRRISLSNQMSLRTLLDLPNYPHNCIIPLPYPVFTIDELQHIEVHALAYTLARSKLSVTAEHALITSSRVKSLRSQQAKGRQSSLVLAIDGRADETLAMTNMSLGRLVDIDWTGVGGGKTVFQYKYLMTAGSLPFSNMVTIAGRLGDGTVALEVVLNRKRMRALEDAVARLGGNGAYAI